VKMGNKRKNIINALSLGHISILKKLLRNLILLRLKNRKRMMMSLRVRIESRKRKKMQRRLLKMKSLSYLKGSKLFQVQLTLQNQI
jgi:hypothetical protein